jgi:hypothetical protein
LIKRLLKLLLVVLILAGGYLVYVNFFKQDACEPPDGAPVTWEPPITCLPGLKVR